MTNEQDIIKFMKKKNMKQEKYGICDVHKWAYGDNTNFIVRYCSACKAWICEECRKNYTIRAIAAIKRKWMQLFENKLL